ncbi:uncharacterized protein [Misgurnus anguillicaudatus]|uniref:uncharacterized protein isoform X1 n=1 Tax=Misgurnus anguillicaudatus TaxID=75329 RepID=UPI003CCF5CAE
MSHPSKPCHLTSTLASKSYTADGYPASALHTMAVQQVYQAKLLRDMDETVPDPSTFKDLCSATDLALRATKVATQAVGRAMASLVVLERHLLLNLTESRIRIGLPFLTCPCRCRGSSALLWKGSPSALLRHRNWHRLCGISFLNDPPQRLRPAAQNRRQLNAQNRRQLNALSQRQLNPSRELNRWSSASVLHDRLARLDAAVPALGSRWTRRCGRLPEENLRRKRGSGPASAGPPSKVLRVSVPSGAGHTPAVTAIFFYLFTKRANFLLCTHTHTHTHTRLTVHKLICSRRQTSQYAGLDSKRDPTRLFTSIRSETTPVLRRSLHHCPRRTHADPQGRGAFFFTKRRNRDSPGGSKQIRLLQSLFSRSKERRRPQTDIGSTRFESRSCQAAIQNAYSQTNHGANSTGRLVHISGSERCLLSHSDSTTSQAVSKIRVRRDSIPVQSSALRIISGTTHIYQMCGCGSRPSQTERHPHIELPRRLAYSSRVREGNYCAQDRCTPAFGEFRVQNQPPEEFVYPHPANRVLRHDARLVKDAGMAYTGTRPHGQTRGGIV